ncbi:beta strand repeat-containing protein, partial [Patescibacteria group bacterium]
MLSASANHLRKLGASRKARKRVLGMVVFTAFSAYFFLSAVPVEAANCPTGADVTINTNCEWLPGTHNYTGTLTILDGVTVTAGYADTPGQVVINAEDIVLNGLVSGNGLGSDTGTGAGGNYSNNTSGGGYGGWGGESHNFNAGGTVYGSVTAPVHVGSGGGNYSGAATRGGGAIKFDVSGTFDLGTSGEITMNGATAGYYDGGGSGGAIWIQTGSIAGTGSISTDGSDGSGYGSAGGGGRIAIEYDVDDGSDWTYSAKGGNGGTYCASDRKDGGAGTIWTSQFGADGHLTVDNAEREESNYTDQTGVSNQSYDDITIKSAAEYRVPNTYTLTLNSGGTLTGGGTRQSLLVLPTGGTFNPVGATTFNFNDVDVDHDGTISTVTHLQVQNATFVHAVGSAAFNAGLTDLTAQSGGTFSVEGTSTFSATNITINPGGNLTHEDNSTTKDNVLNVSATNLTVNGSGYISVNDRGYDVDQGPGAGHKGDSNICSGGGHGGVGGYGYYNSVATAGGDVYDVGTGPTDLGSGGGNHSGTSGGTGGGAIKLTVTNLTNNGTISADGRNGDYYDGGGAGGSIWLDTGTISGSGTIIADGGNGNGYGNGGAGGRIAIYYDNGTTAGFSTISAYGGLGGVYINYDLEDGGAGTIFIKDNAAPNGDLTVDNGSNDQSSYTDLNISDTFDSIAFNNDVKVRIPNTYTLTLAAGGSFTGSGAHTPQMIIPSGGTFDTGVTGFTFANSCDVDLYSGGSLASVQDLTIGENSVFRVYDTGTFSVPGTLTVAANGTLTHGDNSNAKSNALIVSATNINVQTDGTIDADGLGYDGTGSTSGYGPGGGGQIAGGGHGGNGGNSEDASGGVTYGSVVQPTTLGSGGGGYSPGGSYGSSGGGAIKLVASGTLTINGTVSADGGNPSPCGNGDASGAGGSIWLDAPTISGSGSVTANGGPTCGSAYKVGGGGGGRISVHFDTGTVGPWNPQAYGGDGTNFDGYDGGAGTIYIRQGSVDGDLIVNNGTRTYSNFTDQADDDALDTPKVQAYDNITIDDDSRYRIPSGFTLTLNSAGGFTTGGTERPQLTMANGGTFVPTGYTTWTFDDIDVDHDGALAVVTDLFITDSLYELNTTTATYSAGTPDVTVQSGGTLRQDTTTTYTLDTLTVESGGDVDHADNSTAESNILSLSVTTLDVQSDGTISVDGTGYDGTGTTSGYGPGGGGKIAGGGYGGNGGDSEDGSGGVPYGSVTEPSDIGSGGGGYSPGGSYGAAGGGRMKIVVSGTLTNNGTISADGGTHSSCGNGNAGGSGGSVWLQADTVAGSGTVQANGSDICGGAYRVGGGGGGRVAIYFDTGSIGAWTKNAYGGDGTNYDLYDGGAGTIYIYDGAGNGNLIVGGGDRTRANYTDMVDDDALGSPKAPTYDNITVRNGAHYRVPDGYSLTLDTGGTFTGSGGSGTQSMITVLAGGAMDLTPAGTIDDCDITNNGTITGTPTMSNENGDWINTGTVVNVVDFTCTGGTCTNSGTFDTGIATVTVNSGGTFNNSGSLGNGVTTLTVNSGGTFVQTGTTALFSGSTLTVDGGTFVQDHTDVISASTINVVNGGTIRSADNSTSKGAQVYLSATNMTVDATSSVEVSGYGYDTLQGPAPGTGGLPSPGGGHYTEGGDSDGGAAASANTYDDPNAPVEMGSGGGAANGGAGGGVVKLVVSDTLTLYGDIYANGNDAAGSTNGGGAGGSIWLDVGTINCDSGSITADGGDGLTTGGGGAGGLILIKYTTTDYTSCPRTVAGGTTGTGDPGSAGVLTETENAPTITSFTVTPSDPTVNDALVAEVDATYDSGIDYIRIYVDGSPPGTGLVHTCAFAGSPTSASCDYEIGRLSRGDHTVTAIVTGSDATTRQQGIAVSVAGETTLNRPHFDRLQVSEEDVPFTLSFELAGTSGASDTLTVWFPVGFSGIDVTSASGTCSDAGTIANWTAPEPAGRTAQADKISCAGTVTVTGITIDLPGDVDTYVIEWSNDDGAGAVAIVDDDQITVRSNVDPSITFDIDVSTTDIETSAPYTVALGEVSTADTRVSGSTDGIPYVWIDFETN